jgi:hypothetical protein
MFNSGINISLVIALFAYSLNASLNLSTLSGEIERPAAYLCPPYSSK